MIKEQMVFPGGSLRTGIAAEERMIDYCPWGRITLEAEPSLKLRIGLWADESTIFLSPKD